MESFFELVGNNSLVLVTFLLAIVLLVTVYSIAFIQGREISFWPPTVGPRPLPKGEDSSPALSFLPASLAEELEKPFNHKMQIYIGSRMQNTLLNIIKDATYDDSYIAMDKVRDEFKTLKPDDGDRITSLFYRLEQLRLYGFIERVQTGRSGDIPIFSYRVTKEYLGEESAEKSG